MRRGAVQSTPPAKPSVPRVSSAGSVRCTTSAEQDPLPPPLSPPPPPPVVWTHARSNPHGPLDGKGTLFQPKTRSTTRPAIQQHAHMQHTRSTHAAHAHTRTHAAAAAAAHAARRGASAGQGARDVTVVLHEHPVLHGRGCRGGRFPALPVLPLVIKRVGQDVRVEQVPVSRGRS